MRRYGVPFFCEFVGDRETNATVFLTRRGKRLVGKYFVDTPRARAEVAAERESWAAFSTRPWRMPLVRIDERRILAPRIHDENRLDVRARAMSHDERVGLGSWAVDVLLEIYLSGHLHGDFQPHNLWFLDGRPVVTDWATFARRTPGISFFESADVTGYDPAYERRFDPAFDPADPWSFYCALGVTLDESVARARQELRDAPDGHHDTARKLAALEGQPT
ncbi:hypothetical protein [Microbacterium kribbense]